MVVCGPSFCGIDHIDSLTVIVGCLLGGERIFAYYPGMIWSMVDLPFGPLSGEGERTGKYRPEEIVCFCSQPPGSF